VNNTSISPHLNENGNTASISPHPSTSPLLPSGEVLRPSIPMSVITNIPSPLQSVSSASSSDLTSSVHSSMSVSTSSTSNSSLNPTSSYFSNFSSTSDMLPFCLSASSTSNMTVPSLPFLPLYLSGGGGVGGGELDDSGGGSNVDRCGGSMAGADVLTDFASRHIKRRCSSSADDHDNREHSTSRPSLVPVGSSASARPLPVITEYAPTLPRFSAPTCIIPFLPHPPGAAQTVLATSNTNALHSGFSNSLSIDGLHQVPSLNCELKKGNKVEKRSFVKSQQNTTESPLKILFCNLHGGVV